MLVKLVYNVCFWEHELLVVRLVGSDWEPELGKACAGAVPAKPHKATVT